MIRENEAMEHIIQLEWGGRKLVAPLSAGSEPLTVGRGRDCSLILDGDGGVSKVHARFFLGGDGPLVEDLQSTNGTFLNGKRLSAPCLLSDGDVVRIGFTDLFVHLPRPTPPEPRANQAPISFEKLAGHTCVVPLAEFRQSGLAPCTTEPFPVVEAGHVLQEIAISLLKLLEPEDLFQHCLNLIVEAIPAGCACLMLLENGELTVAASRSGSSAISSPQPGSVPFSQTLRRLVLDQRSSVLTTNVADHPDLESAGSIMLQGIRSVMAVPLWNEDRVWGLLYLDSPVEERSFNEGSLRLLTAIANLVTMKIENHYHIQELLAKRALEKELEVATEVQRFLLPDRLPRVPGIETAFHYHCFHQLGGDYYQCFRVPGGGHLFIVADVMGKGVGAALLVSALHTHLSLLARRSDLSPAELVTELNRNIFALCGGNFFITLFALFVDPDADHAQYVNAGHDEGLLLRADGSLERLTEGGPLLGLSGDIPYSAADVNLFPGDLLALYTDGLTESESPEGELWGREGIALSLARQRFRGVSGLVPAVIEEASAFRGDAPPRDDLTLLVLGRVLQEKSS